MSELKNDSPTIVYLKRNMIRKMTSVWSRDQNVKTFFKMLKHFDT